MLYRVFLFCFLPLALSGQCVIPDSLVSAYLQCYGKFGDHYLVLRRYPMQCEWRGAQWQPLDLPPFWMERRLLNNYSWWIARSSRSFGIFDLSTGTWVLPLEYSYISEPYHRAVCIVRKGEAEGLLSVQGKWLYEPADSQRFAVIKEVVYRTTWQGTDMRTTCRLLDLQQEMLSPTEYDFAEKIADNAWRVRRAGKEGVANAQGLPRIPLQYDSVYFDHRFFITKKAQQYGIYTYYFQRISEPQYDAVQPYHGWGFIARKGDQYSVFNRTGKRLFDYSEPLVYWNDGLYYVLERNDTSYRQGTKIVHQPYSPGWWLDTTGRKVEFPLKNCIYTKLINNDLIIKNKTQAMLLHDSRASRFLYDDIVHKGGDWLAIRDKRGWGLATLIERIQITPQYASIDPLSLNAWRVQDSTGRYGAVSSENDSLVPLRYDSLQWEARSDVFVVWQAGKCGIYTKKGKNVQPCVYLDYRVGSDRIWLQTEQGWLLAAPSGKLLLAEPIAEMRSFDCDSQKKIARKGDKWGILDELSGQWFVPAQCDKIVADCAARSIRVWMKGEVFCLDRNYQLLPCVD